MKTTALLLATVLSPCLASAQEPAGTVERTVRDEADSRALFASLDRTADDRLDLFEARGIGNLAGPRGPEIFRQLDLDRNGFLSWPEFDAHFQSVIDHRQVFRLRAARPHLVPADPRRSTPGPQHQILDLLDKDGSEALETAEIQAMLALAGLPPADAAQIAAVDSNGSGALEATELDQVLALVPNLRDALRKTVRRRNRKNAADAPPLMGADRDGDGRVSREELATALRIFDPALVHWTERILREADRNGNGVLESAEGTARPSRTTPSRANR